ISTFFLTRSNLQKLRNYRNISLKNTTNFAKNIYPTILWNFDREAIQEANVAILKNDFIIAINLKNEEKLFFSGAKKSKTPGYEAVIEDLTKEFTISEENSEIKIISTSISLNHLIIGYVDIFYTEQELIKNEREMKFEMIISFIVNAFLIIIISFFMINQFTIKPILALAKFSKKVAQQSDFSQRLEKRTNDEVGILYDGFNTMLEQIHQRDIQRDIVEKELKKTKKYLSSIINSIKSVLITINKEKQIIQFNEAAEIFTNFKIKDAIGKEIWPIVPDLYHYRESIEEIMVTKIPKEYPRVKFKNKSKQYYSLFLYPLLADQINGLVIRIDDITNLEKKDEQLRQAQKMETVGNLAGGLAHDFNNVLGGITGSLSLLNFKIYKEKKVELDFLKQNLDTISKSTDRATSMVQQLLSLSRKQNLTLVPVDLNQSIKNVMKICSNSFDKRIELNPVYNELALVKADPVQLEQVFLNLCINASHAMTIMRPKNQQPGGKLNISIESIFADEFFLSINPSAEKKAYWEIQIKDNGIGMSKQTIEQIFEPFYTTKEKGIGTGLGLSMVYNIIKNHNGIINVYSEIDVGTSFSIYLPLLDNLELVEEQHETLDIIKGEGLILVADDEPIMRQIAQSILVECGYDVILANDGEECVNLYMKHHQKIKAILLDMLMPKMSGKEVYLEIKKINPQVNVLLASGFKRDEKVNNILNHGIKGFIKKPYTMEKLSRSIYNIINEKS
ncbi:MAG: response regulator, partial [Spirochaetes bacterium]|nr:response regulator [Spirochaetota bacterium]